MLARTNQFPTVSIMIRNAASLSNYFCRNLILTTQNITCHGCHGNASQTLVHRSKHTLATPIAATTGIITNETTSDDIADEDCGATHAFNERNQASLLKNPNKDLLLKTIRQKLDCDAAQAFRIYHNHADMRQENVKNIMQIVDYLFENGVTGQSILDNSWLLTNNYKSITIKLPLLQLTQPNDINDFVPLMRASPTQLNKICKLTKCEGSFLPGRHRVYYMSHKLGFEPKLVSKYLSTHLFMFQLTYENFTDNLDLLLKYNVAPINILRDLWAFRYSPQLIETRLSRAADGQKDKLMPWMVRCPEQILAKSIQNSVDEKQVMGEHGDIVQYIADRIGYDIETTKSILAKHPSVYNVRVTKVKEILDYLLNETEYTSHDIAKVPRILCHSLETTRQRLDELKTHGCHPSTLVIVCKSANEYRKFVEQWLRVRSKIAERQQKK